MKRNTVFIISALFIIAFHFSYSYAYTNSTQTTYCANGICSTGGTPKPFSNSTIGLYAPGIYNGPSPLALSHSSKIGIMLSKTCETMEKNNITSGCLTYDKLTFLDNTNPAITGKWLNDTWYHRGPPAIKNGYKFYSNGTTIMVDPDAIFASQALLITVVDKNFTWINPDDTSIGGLITITHHNRSVLNCEQATVAPNIWLINDTVNYLKSGCTTTLYNETQFNSHNDIPFSYDNPFSTLHHTDLLKQLFKGHTFFGANKTAGGLGPVDCIHHQCNYTDPYKNKNW